MGKIPEEGKVAILSDKLKSTGLSEMKLLNPVEINFTCFEM